MNITPLAVASGNYMDGRQGKTVGLVVIHTMVGSLLSASGRFGDPSAQVSAHYGIDLDGAVYQWVDEDSTAYHAGDWGVNLRSVGIEHADDGDYNGVRPDALYTASAELVRDICTRRGIPIDRTHIVGHREVHATACPDALDIDRIVREAAGGEEDMATPQEIWDGGLSAIVQAKVVAPQENTNQALKDALAQVAAAADTISDPEMRVILTKLGIALQSVGGTK